MKNKIIKTPLNLPLTRETLKRGFTLVELLVVIAIISILTIISVSSFTGAQIKARDSQRKSDLDAVSKALMMYFNDKGVFPDDFAFDDEDGFNGDDNIIYMRKTPKELKNGWPIYIYEISASKKSFNLFADLENRKDSQCSQNPDGSGTWSRSGNDYCYGVASPNTIVGNVTP